MTSTEYASFGAVRDRLAAPLLPPSLSPAATGTRGRRRNVLARRVRATRVERERRRRRAWWRAPSPGTQQRAAGREGGRARRRSSRARAGGPRAARPQAGRTRRRGRGRVGQRGVGDVGSSHTFRRVGDVGDGCVGGGQAVRTRAHSCCAGSPWEATRAQQRVRDVARLRHRHWSGSVARRRTRAAGCAGARVCVCRLRGARPPCTACSSAGRQSWPAGTPVRTRAVWGSGRRGDGEPELALRAPGEGRGDGGGRRRGVRVDREWVDRLGQLGIQECRCQTRKGTRALCITRCTD
ncbi:hypothetical protein FA95DRAFT_696408 [Auriscalpium vulgare]|uniref:Uncharacterized protein n=1 Tax=Auriscalpium vulgare TaxID=40419 RepID=A0ACB8RB51_9AGAM|nr:hypothetical protein FA95DRAFT_696408 [Auriscalpium vulgare]